ncbi:dihydroxyacetone kinase subunit L [Virgibacillus sp. NKC19-3]|uniref:dihydroxyacetone kinase subunit DhaL n=1 Tax=Virgibacillus saliphilus TaxID=2831674 RepID=UPI001C9B244F|nr:dihydroxyacetone kinase subunit DhaL [Virgibacillus sp. NKC19-3]MBY7144238.1 dihydroxyacetone kinase subunit L [Virgibacillus sp. NKC19-3]
MEFQAQDTIQWIEKINEKMQRNKEYLTSLDQVIGDSDHGINMSRGFQETVNKISGGTYDTASDVLKDVAMTLMSKVGGASGPLFGTLFLKLSTTFKGMDPVDYHAFTNGLEEALNGVMQRGKATTGEKTLVDVWSPVVEHFKQEDEFQADKIVETAKTAMENTKDMLATKGRAAYFKEKSIGHIDPGSASSYYIFEALAEVMEGGK